MKKSLLILLCFFLVFGCNFENSKTKTKTEESKTAITYERSYGPKLIEYVWDGDRRTERYDMNDSVIEVERIYINGVLDSSTEFYGTGNLWFQTQYKDGVRHGDHVCYNEDKTVKYTQVYENDSLISYIEKTY